MYRLLHSQLRSSSCSLEPADEDIPVVVPHNRQRREDVRIRHHWPPPYDWAVLLSSQPPCSHGVPGPILHIKQLFFLFASPVMARPQKFSRWVAELLFSVNAITFTPCVVEMAFNPRYWTIFWIHGMSFEWWRSRDGAFLLLGLNRNCLFSCNLIVLIRPAHFWKLTAIKE